MSSAVPPSHNTDLDRYVVIHVATTCDEHGVYVTKDSAEVIELGWILLDAKTCDEIARDSVLVKPVNTPITPLCSKPLAIDPQAPFAFDTPLASLTTLTWEHVRNAGDFRAAIQRFEQFHSQYLAEKNLNFAFVTLDSWDLRVQLPREARDKAVVLPLYLQHSKTFDLRTEYQRWQAHHPESLPFGSSALSNICAALEVEPVQSSAPIKHNLPFHLQALAPASPRRAMEEAVTLARVLRGLLRKSQPASDHPDVLTRPMDANADVRAFLGERSKVLHLSGLPHDTTQSELESWFTQFGGRPIAFWTLRTPEQHKPTGTGFAVFSSHEEAAESLCMNGRALNEKAIEVSPSSARVLDRAAEILTPFPPSKNRPRPGDWTCPSCGFSNFQRRTACFRCSYPAMGHGPVDNMGGNNGGYGYGYPPNVMGGHHMGGGGGHGHGHGGMHSGGGRGGIIPFRAGDWKCGSEACQYHNFAKNVSCLRCGASRATASVVADSGFNSPMPPPPPTQDFGMHTPQGPGPAPYGAPGYGSGGGFHGQQFGAPPGAFGMPSAPGPFPPMGPQFGQPGAPHPPGAFDGRGSGEAAFASGGPGSASGGPGLSNGGGSGYGGGFEGQHDPFSFLSSGIGGLSMNDHDSRRNGANNSTKSPS